MTWQPERFAHRHFARVADLVARIAQFRDWPSVADLDAAFREELAGMRLVEAEKTRPAIVDGAIDVSSLYEVRIADTGEIPTRPRNAHDLLNALVWAAFPRSKLVLSRALAAIQRERATGQPRMPPQRTPEHDRLALLDEGAMLLAGTTTWIFGHAIYEHAYAGEQVVRGAAVDLDVAADAPREVVDRCFADADWSRVMRRGAGIPIT